MNRITTAEILKNATADGKKKVYDAEYVKRVEESVDAWKNNVVRPEDKKNWEVV
jgi:hypothetical protein